MGIANYTNLSEMMNERLGSGPASIADLVEQARARKLILASEGEMADQADLENGFIELVNVLYRAGAIRPEPADEEERQVFNLYESGALAAQGYGGREGDRFLKIKWAALTVDLPVIVNINI